MTYDDAVNGGWLVIFQLDADPGQMEVTQFAEYQTARDLYDRLNHAWTGIRLCKVLRSGDLQHDQQPEDQGSTVPTCEHCNPSVLSYAIPGLVFRAHGLGNTLPEPLDDGRCLMVRYSEDDTSGFAEYVTFAALDEWLDAQGDPPEAYEAKPLKWWVFAGTEKKIEKNPCTA